MGLTKPTFKKQIVWHKMSDHVLRAEPAETPNWKYGLGEEDMDPVQKWCEKHHCGKRTSFDTFMFADESKMTMFLLHWGVPD